MQFKKFGLAIMLSSCLIFCGCSDNVRNVRRDENVDMRAGMISTSDNTNITTMLADIRPAVVGIEVALSSGYAVGSGVATADGGYILTNHHVVKGEKGITLYFADLTQGKAKTIWSDPALDLAIIQSERNIPYLQTRNSSSLLIGEDVFAVGTPLTLQFKHTVTKGIVSALNRTLEIESSGNGASFLQSLIQHDASINPGNSGGPLISENGKLIGINTLKASNGEGIGFAIPIEVAVAIASRIVEDNNYKAPYLGIFGFDTTIAEAYGQAPLNEGVYVISSNGPSLEAGIKNGDIITKVDNYDIKTMLDLRIVIYNYDIGDEISVTYIRDNTVNKVVLKSSDRT